jgi:RNA polymerase sigma factor (sigma-70 family)
VDSDQQDIAGLLNRLGRQDSGSAWEEFLRLYVALIMNSVRRFEFREARQNDCFLYVCEKLSEKEFRRLRSYKLHRGVRFATWLSAVVFNLCVDWHRKEFGRARLLPAISALPAFDQLVYRYHFEKGMPASESLQALREDFPEADQAMLTQAMARIHQLMTPRQRWQAGVRLRRWRRQDNSGSRGVDDLPSPLLDPFATVSNQQEIERLDLVMRQLPRKERLMLQLRYQEGLTLRQVADHFDLEDTNRAWRCVQEALKKLSLAYSQKESAKSRKS